MTTVNSNSGARSIFKELQQNYAKIGKGNVRLTRSGIFLTTALSASKSAYAFDSQEQQATSIQPDEIRINLNDEFILTSMGFYLYGTIADTGGHTSRILLPYAPLELGFAAIVVQDLWAGRFSLAVNKITYMDKWPLRKHLFVPRTQFVSFVPNSVTPTLGQQNYPPTQPSLDLSKDGMITLDSNITLSGSKTNNLDIDLPFAIAPCSFTWTTAGTTATTYTLTIDRLAFKGEGFLAQNAAAFQGVKQ